MTQLSSPTGGSPELMDFRIDAGWVITVNNSDDVNRAGSLTVFPGQQPKHNMDTSQRSIAKTVFCYPD